MFMEELADVGVAMVCLLIGFAAGIRATVYLYAPAWESMYAIVRLACNQHEQEGVK